MLARSLRAVAILFGVLLFVCAVMFFHNRPALYYAACKVGLPNATRPAELSASQLDCTILGDKKVYSGVLFSGYHGRAVRLADGSGAAFHCAEGGCGPLTERQLARPKVPNCPKFPYPGMASVEVEGWRSLYPTGFGEMNRQPTEIYASRILKVGPPPTSEVDGMEAALRKMHMCD